MICYDAADTSIWDTVRVRQMNDVCAGPISRPLCPMLVQHGYWRTLSAHERHQCCDNISAGHARLKCHASSQHDAVIREVRRWQTIILQMREGGGHILKKLIANTELRAVWMCIQMMYTTTRSASSRSSIISKLSSFCIEIMAIPCPNRILLLGRNNMCLPAHQLAGPLPTRPSFASTQASGLVSKRAFAGTSC